MSDTPEHLTQTTPSVTPPSNEADAAFERAADAPRPAGTPFPAGYGWDTSATAAGQGGQTIRVGTHPALNRLARGSTTAALKADKRRLGAATADGWQSEAYTLTQLADLLDNGHGIAADFTDGHRLTESALAQFIAVDFDQGNPERAAIEASARALGCAAIIGETATAGRFRVIIPIAEVLNDPEQFRDFAARVSLRFDGAKDPAGGVIAQQWMGFRKGTTHVFDGDFLTTAAIMAMPAPPPPPERPWRREPAAQTSGAGQDRRAEFINVVVLPAIERAATRGRGKVFGCINPDHPDKHPSARIGISRDGGTVYYCTCGTHSLTTVGRWLGLDYRQWLRDNYPDEFKHKPKKSVRRRLEKQARSAISDSHDYRKPSLKADHTLSTPLLDRLPAGVTSAALQSGVGTFKTGLAIGEMGRCPGRSLYLTDSKTLAEQFVERAGAEGVIVELYSELLKSDLYRAARLSACINTLVLYVKATGEMPPPPELLILDEISAFVEQVLIGGTLEGDELHTADQLVRYLLASAKQVLVMDAHISPAALDYVRSARPDIPTVVNTYQTPRGNMYLCEKRGRAIGSMMQGAMQGKRVACASFSVDQGQAIADELAAMIGSPEAVLFIHAGNRGEARQAAFLRDPNTEALKYQAIVYSPVIGKGYSITPAIDVLAVLANQQQSAEDVRQFVGRFRNVKDTYVWLPDNQDVRETNAQAITDRLIAAAERTAHPYVADGRLQRSISPQARAYVQHHAAVRAGRNASLNQLRERFISLCAGSYTLQALDDDDPATTAIIIARRAEIDAHRRRLALTAPRIDRETFKRKQDAGLVSESDHAGHIAWTIERLVGSFNETWRDRLWTEHKRKTAANHADVFDNIAALQHADLEEAAFDDPLHKRQHRVERLVVTKAFLRPLIDAAGELVEYSAAALEATYRPIIEHHAEALRLYFGWYAYRTNTAPGILRLVLRRIDLLLSGSRRRVTGETNPVQFYRLDANCYHAAVETAMAIATRRAADREDAIEARIAPSVRKLQNAPKPPLFAESVQADGPTGWAANPQAFAERMALLGALGRKRVAFMEARP